VKVVKLSASRTGRLYSLETSMILISVRGSVDSRPLVWGEWIMSVKNPHDPIGNGTRDLQTRIAEPQPTAPLRDWYS